MKKSTKFSVWLAIILSLSLGALRVQSQTVIWTDNYNIADTLNLDSSDNSTTGGRHTGSLLGTNVVGISGGIELTVTNQMLNLLAVNAGNTDGRMRFCPSTNTTSSLRYNWASGPAGAQIVGSGGMKISFDWTAADNTSGNWISYSVGVNTNSDTSIRVANSGTDSGILLRNSGGAQVFKLGTGGATGTFASTSPVTNPFGNIGYPYHVDLYYSFNSWADGSPVSLTAYVNSNLVVSQSFAWNNDGGIQNMEISSIANGSKIDNFTVYSLPTSISAGATTLDSPSTNYIGRPVTLSGVISGTAPLTEQWQANYGSGFVNISGATNSTLVLTNTQMSNSGVYQLVGSNIAGTTNTTPSQVVFITPPTNDQVNVQFTGFTGGGTPAATQTGMAAIGNSGDVWTTIFSTGGNFTAGTGGTATNFTPVYLNDAANNGTTVTLNYIADYLYNAGAGPFASTSVAGLMSGVIAAQSARTGTLTIGNLKQGDYDLYVYSQNSSAQNRSSTIAANGVSALCGPNASANSLASPTNYVHLVPSVNSDGVLTITFTGAATGDAQINGLQISGPQAAPTLTLAGDTTINPSTVYAGYGQVTLAASFVGTQPITNQWKVNTGSGFTPIAGATNTTLILTNLQVANSGNYALFSSNRAGSFNSTPTLLTVLAAPTNISLNVQFTGSWLNSGNAPAQVGGAVIGNGSDVWNIISNPTGGTAPAGLATATNLTLVDVNNIGAPMSMDYIGDYVFNGLAFGNSNPFVSVASPFANLMSGYMGSVSQGSGADTNTITVHNLIPGSYDIYLYVCGRNDGQTRVDVIRANGQSAVCGPNNNNYSLISGINYVHLTPTVTSNGLLSISYYGTADAGQALLNGFQINGPVNLPSLSLSSDTTSDSPSTDYVGRRVSFTASFAGYPTPALQWEVDHGSGFVNVPNATNSTLTLNNAQVSDSGSYSLFATNLAGTLNSTPVSLTIVPLPGNNVEVNVQFIGTSRGSGFAATQVGGAVIGGGSDLWNPVSNPNPVASDTNLISGAIFGLADANDIGTSISLSYTGNTILNSSGNTPFNGSGSPAANLMQACLGSANTNTATVTMQGIQPGTYDLYLYSSAGNALQNEVSQLNANGTIGTVGPNSANNVLTPGTNYLHLTPTITSSGVLNLTLTSPLTGQAALNGIQLFGPGAIPLTPVAGFSGTPTNAFVGQAVKFTDASSGTISTWVWNFGDGSGLTNSSNTTVSHAYASPGTYTVSLVVNGANGSNAAILPAYITVNSVPTIGNATLSGGNLILSGVNGTPGAQYRILTTTDLLTPLSAWVPVGTNVFGQDGSYSFTNSTLNNAAAFFRLVTP